MNYTGPLRDSGRLLLALRPTAVCLIFLTNTNGMGASTVHGLRHLHVRGPGGYQQVVSQKTRGDMTEAAAQFYGEEITA